MPLHALKSFQRGFITLVLCATISPMAQAQDSTADIRQVLLDQAAAWNRGDIPAFMTGYENAETTTFIGATVTRGYQKVLESYLKRYPTRGNMGQLTFSDLEVRPLGADYASVIGRWYLLRVKKDGGNVGGVFSLIFRNTEQGWRIIQDHTTSLTPPKKPS
ncbi:YybH family protein [Anthocerotibacter panamensis]|uniref:YybH family protein n=1 Tax=Anthocerotibacter panamensis TaxID=2857077 RepID=UPI001C404866|nr:nuclear transport factor 2 family protein [Anthocerotibacter panamensis]